MDSVQYRKGKIETAVLLHPRCTDQANFVHALRSLEKETDRQDILEMVGASIKRKLRKEMKKVGEASAACSALSAMSAASAAARAEGAPAAEGAAPAAEGGAEGGAAGGE